MVIDKSIGVPDALELLIYVRGVNTKFKITEELAVLPSMKETTIGEDIYLKVCDTLE